MNNQMRILIAKMVELLFLLFNKPTKQPAFPQRSEN